MFTDKWFRIGLAGSIFAAICCFTPVAALAMGAIGLGAYVVWVDAVLFPMLLVFVGILVAAIIRQAQSKV